MAHGFRNLGKNTSFASRRELAWHQLGKTVESMTSEEAIKLGGLDFEVGLAPLYAKVETIERHLVIMHDQVVKDKDEYAIASKLSNNFATYRKDTGHVFGVVGSRYEVVQNTEAFKFFDSIIGEGHATYETVGALGNGEKVFLTAKLPSKLIVKKENIDKYLLLTMAHDGSGTIQAMFTPIRVVCNNTLSMALHHNSNKISIRHTKNALNKLEAAKTILGVVDAQTLELEKHFAKFADFTFDDKTIISIIKDSFGLEEDEEGKLSTRANNILNTVLEYHEVGIGQENIQGTGWGVYNAITGYQQNIQNYRNAEFQFESIYNKNSANIRQKAFTNIQKLVWS